MKFIMVTVLPVTSNTFTHNFCSKLNSNGFKRSEFFLIIIIIAIVIVDVTCYSTYWTVISKWNYSFLSWRGRNKCILSKLFSIHFLGCWRRTFVLQWGASLVDDNFYDLHVDSVRREREFHFETDWSSVHQCLKIKDSTFNIQSNPHIKGCFGHNPLQLFK